MTEATKFDRNGAYAVIALRSASAWLRQLNSMLGSESLSQMTALFDQIVAGEAEAIKSCPCYADMPSEYPIVCMQHKGAVISVVKHIIAHKCPNHGIEFTIAAWGHCIPVSSYVGVADTLANAEATLNLILTETDAAREFMAFVERANAKREARMGDLMPTTPPKKEWAN